MSREHILISQASNLGKILLKGDDSEIIGCADEILLFLNRLQDFIQQNPKSKISLSSFSDILYGLESEPEATLQDKNVCARLFDLFVKLVPQ
ncbi:MAG: hypothetical protein ABSD46_00785 [Bacteroidota bacterium]